MAHDRPSSNWKVKTKTSQIKMPIQYVDTKRKPPDIAGGVFVMLAD
jgi:hypothetical protein